MKIAQRTICVIIAMLANYVAGESQWLRTQGLYGAEVSSMISCGRRLLVGTRGGGVYVFTDDGAILPLHSNPTISSSILDMAGCNGVIWAIGNTLFKSIDNGSTWAAAGATLPSGAYSAVAAQGSAVVVAIQGAGIFRSTDKGAGWITASTGLGPEEHVIGEIRSDSVDFYAAGWSGALYRSRDTGSTWERLTLPGPVPASVPRIHVTSAGLFFDASPVTDSSSGVPQYRSGLLRSADRGVTWQRADYGLPHTHVASMLTDGGMVLASTDTGLFGSADGGLHWAAVDAALPGEWGGDGVLTEPAILHSHDGIPQAGTVFGLYESTDHGHRWQWRSRGLEHITSSSLAPAPGGLLAAAPLGVWRSEDDGATWHEGSSPTPAFARVLFTAYGDRWLIAGLRHDSLYRSNDNGAAWRFVSQAPGATIVRHGNALIAASDEGAWRSTDSGRTWMPSSSGLPKAPWQSSTSVFAVALSALADHGDVLVAGTRGWGAYRSDDGGLTWHAINNGIARRTADTDYRYLMQLVSSGNDLYAVSESGIYHSSDDGNNWSDIGGGNLAVAVQGNLIVSSLLGGGILLSENGGAAWRAVNDGLYGSSAYEPITSSALQITGSTIFATTNAGLWRRSLASLGVRRELSAALPAVLEPNPASTAVRIFYRLEHPADVTLQVVDLLGRDCCDPIQHHQTEGEHQTVVDCSGLVCGAYMYVLTAGDQRTTGTFIVQK